VQQIQKRRRKSNYPK